jgi:transposase
MLAQLQVGQITTVPVPTVTEEAARDLVRAREDVRGDLMRGRHRVSKLLLHHGYVYYGDDAWTGKHQAWLRRIRFDQPGTRTAFEADALAVRLGNWSRFTGPSIGASIGLVPSEHSAGLSRRHGGIIKAENTHVRRPLV